MLLKSGHYKDTTANINYSLKNNIEESGFYLIQGENGIGKTRFIEGVLLQNLKKSGKRMLYFGQDIENQILSFELISLVKTFINSLRKEGSFLKTIFLNDDFHNKQDLNFNEKSTLRPDRRDIKNFILKECDKYKELDIVIFDEADKYFDSSKEFLSLIETLEGKTILAISHIINPEDCNQIKTINLTNREGGVEIEL